MPVPPPLPGEGIPRTSDGGVRRSGAQRNERFARPGAFAPEGVAREEDADALAVRAVLAGDREAYAVLVERHQRKVFGLVSRILSGSRDDAADHAQEVFLRAYRGLASFREESKFSTFLHRVAVNYCLSEIRRRNAAKRGSAVSLDTPASSDGDPLGRLVSGSGADCDPARGAVAEEARSAVSAAIASLEDDLRVLVVLCDIEGRSYEEIARTAGIPIGTVRSRLHRAREVLRERLRSHSP